MFRRIPVRPIRSAEALRLVSVSKIYGTAETTVAAIDDVSLALPSGTFTAIMGPSGSGKSTFLHCAAGLDEPTLGQIFIDGTEIAWSSEAALTTFRRQRVGFVFQQFNLLPTLTVLQNVTLPLRLTGRKVDRPAAVAILERVGLVHRLDHRPLELSGGQQQRVAIARALVTNPSVIFADEPTGALDTRSSHDVLALLSEAVSEFGQTVVMVTHDPVAASYADLVVFFADGQLVGRVPHPTVDIVSERMAHLSDALAARPIAVGE